MDYTSIIDFVDYIYMRERKCLLTLILRAHSCAKLGQRVDKMAKTKWIVPAIAMVLCAASLIGAGYAAYTATLNDTETITADNNFIEMSLGTHTLSNDVDIFYDSDIVYANGVYQSKVWTPYLDRNTTTGAQKLILGSFSVTMNSTNAGDEVTVNGYTLAISALTVDGTYNPLAGATVTAYTDAECTSAATLGSMASGTTYYLALSFNQNGSTNTTDTAPAATIAISYTLTATANITNA